MPARDLQKVAFYQVSTQAFTVIKGGGGFHKGEGGKGGLKTVCMRRKGLLGRGQNREVITEHPEPKKFEEYCLELQAKRT